MLLTYPFDSNGNQCGKPSTVTTDYPYVFYRFPIPLGNLSHHRVCLKSCPNKNQYTTDCYCSTKTEFKSCVLPYSDVAESGIYASEVNNIYETTGYLKRFCLPGQSLTGQLSNAYNDVNKYISISTLEQWLGDVYTV